MIMALEIIGQCCSANALNHSWLNLIGVIFFKIVNHSDKNATITVKVNRQGHNLHWIFAIKVCMDHA